MFIYNITLSVEKDRKIEFARQLKRTVQPLIVESNLSIGSKILYLLTEVDNAGDTFALQVYFADSEDCQSFENNIADNIYALLDKDFKGSYVYFTTLLEEI
jgi:hypothetical protein